MDDDVWNSTSSKFNEKVGKSKLSKAKGGSDHMNYTDATTSLSKGKGKAARVLEDKVDDDLVLINALNSTNSNGKTAKGKAKGKKGERLLIDEESDDDYVVTDGSNHTLAKEKLSKGKAKGKKEGGRGLIYSTIEDDDPMIDTSNYTSNELLTSKGSGGAKWKVKGHKNKTSGDDMILKDDEISSSNFSKEINKGTGKAEGNTEPKFKGKAVRNLKIDGTKGRLGQNSMDACNQFESKPRDLCERFCRECSDDFVTDDDNLLLFMYDGNSSSTKAKSGERKFSKAKEKSKAKGKIGCAALREEFFHWTNRPAVPCIQE